MPIPSRRIALAVAACAVVIATAAIAAESVAAPAAAPPAKPAPHAVVLRRHEAAPRVLSDAVDHAGKPATIACSTCHATRPPNPANRSGADLDLFHQGLQVVHGTNACISCHDPGNYDNLHLADGTKVAFADAMQLCSQCHGPQRRDWEHGAHGGMNGYWDLARGGRVRNTCIQCHDPHVPKYQGAIPMPPPRDRFLTPSAGAAHE